MSDQAADLKTRIIEAASEPQSVSTDGFSATNRPLTDLIAADKHLATKETAAAGKVPIGFTKVRSVGF